MNLALISLLTLMQIPEDFAAKLNIPKECKAAIYRDKEGLPFGKAAIVKNGEARVFHSGDWLGADCPDGEAVILEDAGRTFP